MGSPAPLIIDHFSDVLCIWAYGAQVRVDELRRHFGAQVALRHRFVSVFGSTERKIGQGWAQRGGWPGFAAHTRHVAERFPHVTVGPDAWERTRPATSATAHLFLKAVQRHEGGGDASTVSIAGGLLERASWSVRTAFFAEGRDVARRTVQMEIAEALSIPRAPIEAALDDGTAMAALSEDHEAVTAQKIEGSPTLVLNEGRQKLYGNVGYRVIEANVDELLRSPLPTNASWC